MVVCDIIKISGKGGIMDVRRVAKFALIKLGFKVNLLGFSYLTYAVELVVKEPRLIYNLHKELYIKISDHFKAGSEIAVDRCIRKSIDDTFECRSLLEINDLFHSKIVEFEEKPTSGQLIGLIAEYYNLGLYRYEPAYKKTRR